MQKLTLKDIWDDHRFYTTMLSNIARQLGFANVAICWVFRTSQTSIDLPTLVLWALICSLLFFIFDIGQYAAGAIVNFYIGFKCEKEFGVDLEKECKKLKKHDTFSYLFLVLKVTMLVASYVLLITFYVEYLFSGKEC